MQRLKALIGVLAVAAVFYYVWKIMPPYIEAYQFQQEIQSIARNNEYSPLDENGIRDQVKRKIADIGVPVSPDAVIVQKAGTDVTIAANYSVHIDAIHPIDLTFHPATKNGDKIDPVLPAGSQ
jgi:type IV secretory pathway TrbF-like protein